MVETSENMNAIRLIGRVHFAAVLCYLAIAVRAGAASDAPAWSERVEADWLLAEEVAAQDQLTGSVTTKADAAGGCDGIKNGEWGFHTDHTKNPWWQVDLGQAQSLGRVVIWARTATAERAVRIRVLLSDDGKEFRQVYQHGGTVFYGFKDKQPLAVTLRNESARFSHLSDKPTCGTRSADILVCLHRLVNASPIGCDP